MLVENLKEKTTQEWDFNDINTSLLNYVELDYLSFNCKSPSYERILTQELEKIKPDLRSHHIYNEKNVEKKEKKKLTEKDYDLIFVVNSDRDYYNIIANIPGELANEFLLAVFSKKCVLSKEDFKLSRLDVKISIPTFQFDNLKKEAYLLEDFHNKQILRSYDVCMQTEFGCGYINSRKYRRMTRTYISGWKKKKVWELELKNNSASRLHPYFFDIDYFHFNKTLVLEFISSFKSIKRCEYTDPLLDWNENYLEVIQKRNFPTEKYFQRERFFKQDQENQLKELSLKTLLKKDMNLLNLNLIHTPSELTSVNSLGHMLISHLGQLLIKKWHSSLNLRSQEIRGVLLTTTWDQEVLLATGFVHSNRYYIEVELNELLNYLKIPVRSENRKKVLKRLEQLTATKTSFSIHGVEFHQSIILSMMVDYRKGFPTKVGIIINPYAIYDVLKYGVLFDDELLNSYFMLVKKHKMNEKKRRFFSEYYGFVSHLAAFARNDPDFIKDFIRKRHLKNPHHRAKQLDFYFDVIQFFCEHFKIHLGLKLEDKTYVPVDYSALESLFSKSTNTILQKINFFFEKPESSES